MNRAARAATLILAATSMMLGADGELQALEIVVPAYFYPSPNSPWEPMTAAADDVPITAIMNPGNGPGAFRDNNYVNAVDAFRAAEG